MGFKKAILRAPCRNFIQGLTTSELGLPDYEKAVDQHSAYTQALESCGLEVITLSPDENYPDSVFVEDTALLTEHCAIITNPGAISRRGEIAAIAEELQRHFDIIKYIDEPGTADAGDILRVDNHFYIGISGRTNSSGADQIINILSEHGYTGSKVNIKKSLHLKSGAAYLGGNNLVVSGEMVNRPEFSKFNKIIIPDEEEYAANCLLINNKVLIAGGYSKARTMIESYDYEIIELDMSEYKKLDGGLSCLSLRF